MKFNKISMCLRPFLNGLSFFLGVLFLGLMSCSSATVSSPSSPTEDKTPPTVTISTNESLEKDKTGTITFTFSENVTNFTPDDIQFLPTGFSVEKGKFVTNNQKSYSLQITPKEKGTLTITIPTNSFYDLSGNQNTDTFSNNFSVEDKSPPTVTISTNESLEKDKTGTITFTFSERVKGFTKSDIQFAMNGGATPEKGKFVADDLTSYSLEITPKIAGTLTVTIPANSFYDLSGNQNTNNFSRSFSVEDKTPPTLTINNETLIEGQSSFLSFVFSEKVNNFTPDDIQILSNKANGVNNVEKGNFVTNSQENYSLRITPKEEGILYVSIPTKSFEDLSGNKNNEPYSDSFTVLRSNTITYTISFKLNGGSFISPQITNLKVVDNTAIEQTKLGGILSYPPTGPKPGISAVTRGIFEWRTNGTTYDFSTSVSSDLTLEAVWRNSCGKVETFHPANRNELKTYTDKAISDDATTNLNHIDTSAITDMNNLFNYKGSFNGEIGCWNTTKVTNMDSMFNSASLFNQDISTWNVANVTDMNSMFNSASLFNQDISTWNVANVTDMNSMFYNVWSFNQDISTWNTANVNDMNNMFREAGVFNQDISRWNVANVTDMNSMFYDANSFNQDISSWNVANVTDMGSMFAEAWAFNQDVSRWDVAKVNNMRSMFYNAFSFNQDISTWNVAKVTDMESMFSYAIAFDQDLSKWSVSEATKHNDMFTGSAMAKKTSKYPTAFSSNPTKDKTPPTVTISTKTSFKKDIPETITFTFSEKVTNFTPDDIQFLPTGFFYSINKASFLSNNLTNYSLEITPKIAGTLKITIPANSFEDLSGNQNTDSFSRSFSVEDKTPPTVTIHSETLIKGKSASLSFIFSEKVNNFTPDDIQFLTNGSNGVSLDKSNFVTNNLMSYSLEITPKETGSLEVSIKANSFEDLSGNQNNEPYSNSFTVLNSNTTTHIVSFNLNGGSFVSPQITNLKVLDNTAIEKTKLEEILSYPPTGPKPNIQAVTRDVSEWQNNDGTAYDFSTLVTSDLTLKAVWRNSCGKIETFHPANRNDLKPYTDKAITTNLNHINTSAITDMNNLFAGESSFNGEIGCWNTTKVTNMSGMFNSANAFNQDVSTWNVANVNNMKDMFNRSIAFNQDISRWNTAKVTDMSGMFAGSINSPNAFNQDISSWNVAKVTDMNNMFNNAFSFNQDISRWNVANVTDMNRMFNNAYIFNQDISSWNVAKVTNMKWMFNKAFAFNQDISSWNVANVNNMVGMFSYAKAFNQDISSWNVAKVTNMYSMFSSAYAFNKDISRWNVANVNNMFEMFQYAKAFNQDISTWNVANVNDMSFMFANTYAFNQDISTWNTTNVNNMSYMFANAKAFNQDISTWNVTNVNDMSYMFNNADSFDQDISKWSVNNVTKYDNMFTGSPMESKTSQHPTFSSP